MSISESIWVENDFTPSSFFQSSSLLSVESIISYNKSDAAESPKSSSYFTTASSDQDLLSYITSFITTDTEGNTNTYSGLVIITTDSVGSIYTSSSQFPRLLAAEANTVIWTSTALDGLIQTMSGKVVISTDSIGSWYTSTSKFATIPNASTSSSNSIMTETISSDETDLRSSVSEISLDSLNSAKASVVSEYPLISTMVLSELTKFSSDTSYGSDSPDSSSLLSFKISLSKSINIFESSTYLSSSKKVDSSTMIYWNDSSVLALTSSFEPTSLSKEIVVCPRDGADCSTSQSNSDPSSEPLSLASTGTKFHVI